MSICCFAGHNQIYDNHVEERLYKECERLITEHEIIEFLVGNYGNFDRIAMNTVCKLRQDYPSIKLNLVIPYLTKTIANSAKYYSDHYNEVIISDISANTPIRLKIIKCNEFMINSSDFIICYVTHSWGGAARTLAYAHQKGHIEIINLKD